MTTHDIATLSKLSDAGQTVASSDDDVRGRKVKDKAGNVLGKVDDLLIDNQDHKVRFLQVEHGGFLGIGETKSFIPIDAITRITDDEIDISQSRDHVAAAPRYDPELDDEPTYYGDLYSHYGYRPYFGAGYESPSYQ